MRGPSTTAGPGAGGATAAVRGVLVTAPGDQPPAGLMQLLTRRGLAVAVAPGEVAAMVEFARAAPAVLIVCDPAHLSRPGELAQAVGRYYPGTRCWQFVPAAGLATGGRLTKLDGDIDRPSVLDGTPVSAVGRPPATDAAAGADLTVAAPLLTAEELEMLLGPLPEETPPQIDDQPWDDGD